MSPTQKSSISFSRCLRIVLTLIFLLLPGCRSPRTGSAPPPLTLSLSGASRTVIVTGSRPTRSVQMAALELQHVLRLVTGAEPPIREDCAPAPDTIRMILQSNPPECRGEEFHILFRGQDIILGGKDSLDFGKVDYRNPRTFPSCRYNFHSTLLAAYDFLERYCGVRFYSYGDDGIAFRPQPTLQIRPEDFRHTPTADARRTVTFNYAGRFNGLKISPRDQDLLYLRWKNNLLFSGVSDIGLGLYWRYYKKCRVPKYGKLFIESRPDYFARNLPEKYLFQLPYVYPDDPDIPPQFCLSSPGPVRYFADEAYRVFNGETVAGSRSNIPVLKDVPFYYPLITNDNCYHCRCPECTAAAQKAPYSIRHFRWISEIARAAAARDPRIGISTLVYEDYFDYPDQVDLPENITFQICMSIQSWYHPYIYRHQHGQYRKWIAKEGKRRPLTLWLYLLCPTCEARGIYNYGKFFPVLYPWKTAQYTREFLKDGIRGYLAQVDPLCNILEGYILSQMMFDSAKDPNQMIDEYFRLYYGAAAAPMKSFYRRMEEITWDIRNYPESVRKASYDGSYIYGIHNERNNWHLGTAERIRELDALIRQAEQQADSPVIRRRLAAFRKNIWNQVLEGRKEFEVREQKRNIPRPAMTLNRINGGFTSPDWKSRAVSTAPWNLLDGTPAPDQAAAEMGWDEDNLYIRYHENSPYAHQHRDRSGWFNGLELFFSPSDSQNYAQIVLDVHGKIKSYASLVINGNKQFLQREYGITADSRLTVGGWQIQITIPRKTLGIRTDGPNGFRAHLFRTRRNPKTRKSENSMGWSPIFTEAYADGFYRMGTIRLK